MNAIFTNISHISQFFMRFSRRQIFAALTLAPVGILCAGVILGELARLKVCYLCNFQRFMYLMMAVFAFWGVLFPRAYPLWGALVALTALVGAGSAIYQSWMQFVQDPVIECGFGDPTLLERLVDWLGMQWPSLFMVTGLCSEKDWAFLGLTLANWSTLIFLSFFAALLWLLFLYRPKSA
ncbi:MAG: disulfide bond formation protein B [Candidatus Accumulibacter sp.]|nr:disulfide bond formation protein B [Accumulibacter sp.]